MVRKVDTTAIKFNQACIISLTLLAFLLDAAWLVLFVAVVLAIGTIWPGAALFQGVYRRVLKPLGLLKARVIDDDPAPHRFAQGLGATFLGLGSLVLLVLKATIPGWGLAGLVVILAAINLFFSFCAGCFLYLQLRRLGLIKDRASTF
ncbi:MAG: DUF4395 domain-containing protein [Anaerolineae bacterium]